MVVKAKQINKKKLPSSYNQVENRVYENKQVSPLTLLFYLVVVDENIVLELQTLNSYTLFEVTLFFHKQAFPSTYICKQTKIEGTQLDC